jgi:hypothetical protein
MPGHKCSGRFEKGFKSGTEVKAVLEPIQKRELVHKQRAYKALCGEQAFGRDLLVPINVNVGIKLLISWQFLC